MSETPRIDVHALNWPEAHGEVVPADLARTLERELAAVTRERDLFYAALDCLARLGNEPLLGNSRGNQIAQDALGGRYIAEVEEEQRKRNAERDALRAEVSTLREQLRDSRKTHDDLIRRTKMDTGL